MTTWQLFAETWTWDPSILIGCALLLAVYLAARHGRMDWQTLLYCTGVLVLLLALVSPLEEIGDTYLFSAHMAQHLLLILVVPPLLLWGLSPALAQHIVSWPPAARLERFLGQPWPAWFIGNVTVWVWHLPALYNATLLDERIHILEHLTFLVTATIFWWPVLTPLKERRLPPLTMIPYLFAAAASSSALGIILTFARPGLYPAYLQPHDALGALSLLRDRWGLTPAVDQQIGGLLMWVPGSLVYLSGIIVALVRWYNTPEEDDASCRLQVAGSK